jgi:RNA polymerase sigma-70 factor (ECF subfamily)
MMNKDFELIQRAQKGDMQAFEALLCKYDRMVMNIALSFRNNNEDAKDIYQEVFMRVFKGLKKFKFNSEFSTWIYRITANVCITFHNRSGKYKHESLDREFLNSNDDEVTKLSDILEGETGTDSQAVSSNLSEHINKALNELPAQQKLVFTMKHYDGYKIREIAEIINCTEGTIKRYLFTATNKMRDKLEYLV